MLFVDKTENASCIFLHINVLIYLDLWGVFYVRSYHDLTCSR
jgi:hypothetical protein